jgi:hypothetical protein
MFNVLEVGVEKWGKGRGGELRRATRSNVALLFLKNFTCIHARRLQPNLNANVLQNKGQKLLRLSRASGGRRNGAHGAHFCCCKCVL